MSGSNDFISPGSSSFSMSSFSLTQFLKSISFNSPGHQFVILGIHRTDEDLPVQELQLLNDSMCAFSQGVPGSMKSILVPNSFSHCRLA